MAKKLNLGIAYSRFENYRRFSLFIFIIIY